VLKPFSFQVRFYLILYLKKKKKKVVFTGYTSPTPEYQFFLSKIPKLSNYLHKSLQGAFFFFSLFLTHLTLQAYFSCSSREGTNHVLQERNNKVIFFLSLLLLPLIVFSLDFLTVYMKAVWSAYDKAKNNPIKNWFTVYYPLQMLF